MQRPARERRTGVPRMVERVEQALMRPREVRRVKTLLLWRVCVDFAEEREGAVEVGVPGDGTDGGDSRGGEGCPRGHEALLHGKRRPCARRDDLTKCSTYLERRPGRRTRGRIADTLLWRRGELEDAPDHERANTYRTGASSVGSDVRAGADDARNVLQGPYGEPGEHCVLERGWRALEERGRAVDA